MDFKVTFKETFLEDLERIVRLIAGQNPAAAQFAILQIIPVADLSGFLIVLKLHRTIEICRPGAVLGEERFVFAVPDKLSHGRAASYNPHLLD